MASWQSVCLKERKRKGGKSYLIRWWDGEQSRYGRKFHDKKQAEEYRGKWELFLNGKGADPNLEIEQRIPRDHVTPRRAWADTVETWLSEHSARKKSQITYRSFLLRFAEAESIRHVEDVTEPCVRRFLAGLQKGDKPKSPATVAGYLKILCAFLRSVRPNDCPITDKLVKDWKPYARHKRATPHRYTPADYAAIVEASDQIGVQRIASKGRGTGKPGRGLRPGERGPVWWRAFITLLYKTGLRFNEAARLLWDSVDFENGIISIKPHDKIPGVLPWRPKSRNAIRRVPMPADVADGLAKLQAESEPGVPYVFCGQARYLEAMRKQLQEHQDLLCDVGKQFRRIRKRAGLNVGTLHDWRRSCITDWLCAGLAVPDVVLLSGHDTPDLVLGVYNEIKGSEAVLRAKAILDAPQSTGTKSRKSRVHAVKS